MYKKYGPKFELQIIKKNNKYKPVYGNLVEPI